LCVNSLDGISSSAKEQDFRTFHNLTKFRKGFLQFFRRCAFIQPCIVASVSTIS
jgi:hypothetical protein